MGCVPQNRIQKVPAINVTATKLSSQKPLQSLTLKSPNDQNVYANFPTAKFPSSQSLKPKKQDLTQQTLQKILKKSTKVSHDARFSLPFQNKHDEVNRYTSPIQQKLQKRYSDNIQNKQLSKLHSVDTLSIISKVQTKKQPTSYFQSKQKKTLKQASPKEDVNITFGNNLFGISSSKNNSSKVHRSIGNKQKQLILLNQLRNMNNENVKRINIEARSFNS